MYSLEDIKKLLSSDGRGISIVETSFVNMNTKAAFIHPIHGIWHATPKKVILQKTTHPTEANLNRKVSNIKAREDGEILKKTKATNIARWGVPVASMNSRVQEKQRNTCLTRYGASSVLSIKKFHQKGKRTRKDLYGDENYNNREKARDTCLTRYGVANPTQDDNIKGKTIKTKEDKGLITRPNGISWEALALELGVPRTSLQAFVKENPQEDAIELFIKNRENQISNIEHAFAKEFGVNRFVGSNLGYRPDFKMGDTYINVDGLYWHSQKVNRPKNYHFKLRKTYENSKQRILQFRADDIKYRLEIVRSIVDNINKKTQNKIYARKCSLEKLDAKEANDFLRKNHMMGGSNSRFIGLRSNGVLVSVMGYKVKDQVLDVDRFASLLGHNVIGGLSKLITYLRKNINGIVKIKYWVDLRYGVGSSLLMLGFQHIRDVQGWQWTNFDKTFHRLACKATQEESQNTVALKGGWWQIYDAGQRLFELTL